jgi:tRNA pseudouridine32 synthase
MALVEVPHKPPFREQPAEVLEPPPDVVVTPCDPWPRPYYLENDLRRVYPYHFTYNTFCKERWRNREILDIFASEFRDRPVEYYVGLSCSAVLVLKGFVLYQSTFCYLMTS